MRKILLISLMLLLSVSLVSAFSLSSESASYDVCRGSTITVITIVNGAGDFGVVSEGNAALFTTTVPASFTSSGLQSIYSYINPPSTAGEGIYNLELEVSEGSDTQSENYELNVKDCHGSSLDVAPEKLACACVDSEYLVTLENLGEFTETFELSIKGLAEEWTILSVPELILNAGEKSSFTAVVSPPCNVQGVYEVEFEAKAKQSLASAAAISNLDIQPCYEYDLEFDQESYSLCENVESELSFSIENQGTSDNVFKMNLDPNWVTGEKTISVASGKKNTVKLNALPAFGTLGEFTLELETLSENGAVKNTANTDLSVEKCYGVSAVFEESQADICDLNKDYAYTISVSNSGKLSDTITLALEGPEWVSLVDKKIVLNEGQGRDVKLNVNLPEDVKKDEYAIKLMVTSENGAESEAELELNVAGADECYGINIDVESKSFTVGLEKGKTVSITLENKGLDESTYKLTLSGDAKGFALLNPDKVTLEPGKEMELYLFVSPPLFTEEREYELKISAESIESGIETSETIKVIVSDKAEERNNDVEDSGENKVGFFKRLFSRMIAFLKDPLSSVSKTADVEEVTEEETTEDAETEEEVAETVETEEVTETEDVVEEVEEETTEDVEEAEEEIVEETEVATEEETEEVTETEDVVEEVEEEKIGFLFRLFPFLKDKPVVEAEDVVEEVEEETTEDVEEEETEEEVAETVEEETEEVVEETEVATEEATNETAETEDVVEETEEELVAEVQETTNETETAEESTGETTAETSESTEEDVEEAVDEEEEPTDEVKEVEVGDTTVEIDLDALKQENKEELKMDLGDYKWYIGGAFLIIAIIVILSTGVMRKVIDFFEEE